MHSRLNTGPDQPIRIATASFPADAALDTAVSAALMRRVARDEEPATIRLHRTGRALVFGKLDRLQPGYPEAVAIARAAGYEPVERIGGGRAAVFHEGTVSFSLTVRSGGDAGAYPGIRDRFAAMAAEIVAALAGLGVDARIGAVPGEYCSGEFSVNARDAAKLVGIGQRVIAGGAHIGAVIVVRGAARLNAVLEPVYEALGLDWDPGRTGSVAAELGAEDEPRPLVDPDPLAEAVIASIRTVLERKQPLSESPIDATTLEQAARISDRYRPRS